jgi:NADH:ubiquinone oxidoreductase subunit 6 (subunit J)
MIALVVIAAVMLGCAAVAMSLRNLLHSALLFAATWFGLAMFYLWAGAEFVAFAQVLVYVGAVSMVVLFAVLLTRRARADDAPRPRSSAARAAAGIVTAAIVCGLLFGAVLTSATAAGGGAAARVEPGAAGVRAIGEALMNHNLAALLAVGVLLTVALIGAVIIAAGNLGKVQRR